MSEQEQSLSMVTGKAVPVFVGHRYEQVFVKEFKATIPPHLLAKLPEDDRFLVETMSKLENQYEWLVIVAVKGNGDVLNLDGRLISAEQQLLKLELQVHQQNQTIAALSKTTDESKTKLTALWDWKLFFTGKWAILAVVGTLVLGAILKFLFDWVAKVLKI